MPYLASARHHLCSFCAAESKRCGGSFSQLIFAAGFQLHQLQPHTVLHIFSYWGGSLVTFIVGTVVNCTSQFEVNLKKEGPKVILGMDSKWEINNFDQDCACSVNVTESGRINVESSCDGRVKRGGNETFDAYTGMPLTSPG